MQGLVTVTAISLDFLRLIGISYDNVAFEATFLNKTQYKTIGLNRLLYVMSPMNLRLIQCA